MKFIDWLNGEALRFWIAIVVGSAIGLLAAYGRELHEDRAPNRRWFANRLYVMPLLAAGAAALADMLNLPLRVTPFLSAMASLLAYDLLRVLSARALKEAAGRKVVVGPDSISESSGGLEVAHRQVTQGSPTTGVRGDPKLQPIRKLRDVVPLAPIPIDQQILIDKLMDKPGSETR